MKWSFDELYKLAADRPQSTLEIHKPNDYYGHATVLKQYAQVPPEYQIKAAIEHGPFLKGASGWDIDLNAPLPALFTFGTFRCSVLSKRTSKALFPIGPPISYASHFLDADTLNLEKQRLGKNLLVFPAHSTHWINANYDIHDYCRYLERLGKDFESIRICLYWKDVLRGCAEEYIRHGFECVTAGHIFDPLFLSRLKSIIELATVTTSFRLATHVGYCILMGKPHYVTKREYEYSARNDNILKRDVCTPTNYSDYQDMVRVFAELRDDISPQQKEFVDRHWGVSEHKTVEEMQLILQTTEDIYKKGRNFFSRLSQFIRS